VKLLKLTVVVCLLLAVPFQAHAQNENMTDANYDPVFDDVIDAKDREEAAEMTGVSYRNGNVHVVVEIGADEEMPSGYGIDVVQESEGENTTLVEAWIDADDIRDIAAEDSVERVRQPIGTLPATSETSPEETDGVDGDAEEEIEIEGEGDGKEPDQDDSNEPLYGFTYVVALLALLLAASGRRALR